MAFPGLQDIGNMMADGGSRTDRRSPLRGRPAGGMNLAAPPAVTGGGRPVPGLNTSGPAPFPASGPVTDGGKSLINPRPVDSTPPTDVTLDDFNNLNPVGGGVVGPGVDSGMPSADESAPTGPSPAPDVTLDDFLNLNPSPAPSGNTGINPDAPPPAPEDLAALDKFVSSGGSSKPDAPEGADTGLPPELADPLPVPQPYGAQDPFAGMMTPGEMGFGQDMDWWGMGSEEMSDQATREGGPTPGTRHDMAPPSGGTPGGNPSYVAPTMTNNVVNGVYNDPFMPIGGARQTVPSSGPPSGPFIVPEELLQLELSTR